MTLGGSGGLLPRKIFENLRTVTELLEQFLVKFCVWFWPLILSVSPNMMHFVRTVSIVLAKGDSGILL